MQTTNQIAAVCAAAAISITADNVFILVSRFFIAMSFSSNNSNDRMTPSRSSYIEFEGELPDRRNSLPNIQPEVDYDHLIHSFIHSSAILFS